MDREEIFQTVCQCVAESLAVDEAEIKLQSSLVAELGADSLDFLDIVFGLEQSFDVKLRDTDLDTLIRADFADETDAEGYLNAVTLERFSPWVPGLRGENRPERLLPRDLYRMITVETLVLVVEHATGEKS